MPSTTPKLAFPYPVGTDRVTDGDNAIQALAEKVDALFGLAHSASLNKSVGIVGGKPVGWTPIANVNIAMSAGGVVLLRVFTDCQGLTGTGSVSTRIGTDDASLGQFIESGSRTRAEIMSQTLLYLPSGVTVATMQIQTFANPAAGIGINSARWTVHAFGGTPALT